MLAGDILVFGRHAHGERLRAGSLRDLWQVRRGDRLLWADALRLEGDIEAQLAAPFGFAGAAAYASLIYAGADAAAWRDPLRELVGAAEAGQRAGVTCLPGVLLARWLDRDAARLREVLHARLDGPAPRRGGAARVAAGDLELLIPRAVSPKLQAGGS